MIRAGLIAVLAAGRFLIVRDIDLDPVWGKAVGEVAQQPETD
jgi:hypothetical protein